MHSDYAESVYFNPKEKLVQRKRMDLLYSLPYKDNVTFLSTNVQKAYSRELSYTAYPFLCVVCDEKIDTSSIISKKFTVREERKALIAKYLSHKCCNKSVLYINNSDGFSALCFEGACLGASGKANKNTLSSLKSCFNIFKPQEVMLEGIFDDAIAELCKKENIDFSFLSDVSGLYIDEKQLMLDCLCKI